MTKRKSSKYPQRICHNFPKNYFSWILSKIIFPSFSVDSQIFRKLLKNSPRISLKVFSRAFPKHIVSFHHYPNFCENFETNFDYRVYVFSIWLTCWIHLAGWPYPVRWSANRIVRKRGRMSSHIIIFVTYSFSGRSLMCVLEYFSIDCASPVPL